MWPDKARGPGWRTQCPSGAAVDLADTVTYRPDCLRCWRGGRRAFYIRLEAVWKRRRMSPRPEKSFRSVGRAIPLGLLVVVAAAGGAGATVAHAADPPASASDAAVPAGYSVFSRSRVASRDDLPPRLVKLVGGSSADSSLASSSRRLGDYAQGGRVWAVPSATQPCVLVQMPRGGTTSGACTTAEAFVKQGAGGFSKVTGGYAVWGATPDRVTRVDVSVDGARRMSIVPHANGYSLRVSGRPARIVLRTAHGTAGVYSFNTPAVQSR